MYYTIEQLTEVVLDLESRVDELTRSFLAVTYVAPTKVREPVFRVADGTNWDPGAGKGAYIYIGGIWQKL